MLILHTGSSRKEMMMHSQTANQSSTKAAANQVLFTVEQFATAQPAFTAPALRNLIFKASDRQSTRGTIPGNGLIESGAVVRLGRKVLIHEARFFAWLEAQA